MSDIKSAAFVPASSGDRGYAICGDPCGPPITGDRIDFSKVTIDQSLLLPWPEFVAKPREGLFSRIFRFWR